MATTHKAELSFYCECYTKEENLNNTNFSLNNPLHFADQAVFFIFI